MDTAPGDAGATASGTSRGAIRGGGGGLPHWQPHREQSGLAAVAQGPQWSGLCALRAARCAMCDVACRELCVVLCAHW